jgi:hypothetical protein
MTRILILGCGELASGRPSESALFGRQWTRGRLSERIGLGAGGPLPGTTAGLDWVTLADEVERQQAWRPAVPLGPEPNLLIGKAKPAQAPLLPAWPDLALSQAQWATRELGGAGVLVTPGEWLESAAGRQLLTAWAGEGWSWAALEQVLRKRYSADVRCVAASGLWLRVLGREGGCTFANGPEAARALELAPAILDRALEKLDPELAGRWRREEEPASGWYVHQQIARRIAQALKHGRTSVDLTDGGVLFRFSMAEAQERYRPLSELRIEVALPAEALPWWEQVSRPGYLRSPEGVSHPGIRWEGGKTVLLEGAESRQLASSLALRGLTWEEVDPARLEEALELGSPLPSPPAAEPVDEAPPPTAAPEPQPDLDKVTAFHAFQPQTFSLADVEHRPDRVRVWLDGRRVEAGNVRRSTRHGVYTIEGVPVPHGAIVRIDFEPPQD